MVDTENIRKNKMNLLFSPGQLLPVILICSSGVALAKDEVQMRMVEEPVNMGQWNNNNPPTDELTPKVKPSNFSGPPHLKQLLGKCFEVVENSYKYLLCPFQNVTQHEQSHRWNPYSGILGNWYEWSIENNTFLAMVFKHGDNCGDKSRQVSVTLQCGTRTAIVAVSEPSTCNYAMNLTTPLVCHPHAMLVYPTLTKPLQRKWDDLEGRLYREEVTKQGYNKMLHKIFEEAGLVMDPTIAPKAIENPAPEEQSFGNLETCQGEYNTLLREVERLRKLVNIDQIEDAERPADNIDDPIYDGGNGPSMEYPDEHRDRLPEIDDPFADTF